ncbi:MULTISPECIES: DUF1259 domain-containing protein [Flavobacteriaceae]|uniref:Uncharacterized protein n=2 Tax=Flavobacteriaceae TaxID=49546 RepID=A0A223V856_9FLAO|nr:MULTISPECIES: DUF1259 domain-containing protein [Flavobacteriaceae]ASV31561.1 hypothetical protein CJ263_15815 [Maribacter cobaltidurans]MCL6219324.1 DUF1259 domain-containing protein [Zunongwangia pacifica]GGD95855.1 hypothetical protein GCM10011412_37460 [Maribacter cobaltidurans]
MKKLLIVLSILGLLVACNNRNEKPKEDKNPKIEKSVSRDSMNLVQQNSFNVNEIDGFWNKKLADNKEFYKVTFPRTDIHLKIDGVSVEAGLAYTSWIAYRPMGKNTQIMGDMVLLDNEIPKVIPYLKENGILITAVHNHLLREQPRLIYMHIAGNGDALELSKIMKGAYALTATPLTETSNKNENKGMDWAPVKKILGENGKEGGNLLKYGFPRKGAITMNGNTMPSTFGIATAIGFQAINKNEAVITGDFVMKAEEVNAVITELAKNNIEVAALHNHMLFEKPRLFYMHFWAKGNPEELAKGFKAALDQTSSVQ